MEFIDHTGHIFSLPDYSQFPVGYEYSENPYVFWLSDNYSSQLSVDCFYIKPIYILTDEQNISQITVECNKTKHYKLLSSSIVQEKLKASGMFDNGDKIDWSKANFELEFFTDEAKDLIEKHPENISEDININDDFSEKLYIDDVNKEGVDVESELLYFVGNDGKYYDILNEQLIYNRDEEYVLDKNNSVQIDDFKTTESKSEIYAKYDIHNKYANASFNFTPDSVTKIVYINNDNIPISKDEFKELMTEQYKNYVHNFVTDKDGADITDSIEDINKYLKKYRQSHIRTVYSKKTKYKMIPFYVLGNVKEAGVWMTNLLITLSLGNRNIYCPITVGGTYVDEQEALVINGKNMGIDLPKDICRALYNISFWNEIPDLSLWNQKIKEYLLNYMKLKGERGNFQSAIQALKWFGYGDKLSLSALIQTDNQVINQYICDNFDLNFDVINEFRYFRYSTLLSLSIPGIIEDPYGETNDFEWNNEFWGEGKPKLHDRFSEYIEPKKYDEGDIPFLRPYYDWTFNEIGLKLCALKYYYKKYFLPIHLSIHRASITNQCFANDIKILNTASNLITEKSFYAGDDNFYVKFDDSNVVWMEDTTNYNLVIDPETWIFDKHLSDKIDDYKDIYYAVNDNCFCTDIHFINKIFHKNNEHIFYCKMFTYQNENLILSSNFTLYSTEEDYVIKFVIYPKYFNENFDINFWLDKEYTIKLMVNGTWYEYKFRLKLPELDIELGRLEYKYNYSVVKQFIGFDGNRPLFNAHMYLPDIVSINNINFTNELLEHIEDNDLRIVDKKLIDNELYYYTIKDGQKIILSTGQKTLIQKNNKYYLVPNPYYADIDKFKDEAGNLIDSIVESDTPIYSSICKNISSLIDLYSVHGNIPDNPSLMNKVYIFKLFKKEYQHDDEGNIDFNNYEYNQIKYDIDTYSSGENTELENAKFFDYQFGYDTERDKKTDRKSEFLRIQYDTAVFGDNDTEAVKNLYLKFFDENGDWTKPLEYFYSDENDTELNEWKEEKRIKKYFDLFLMHDYDNKNYSGYWYVILISKDTIGESDIDLDYIIDKTKFYRTGFNGDDENDYYIQYDRSDEKFLINRMNFSRMNGVYHFRTNDTIVARLNNFNNLPHRLKIGSRWTFTPLAFGTEFENHYNSPTNIGLMTIGNGVNKAQRGYYKVEVKYSVDNFVNEVQKRSTKFLIDDSLPIQQSIQDSAYYSGYLRLIKKKRNKIQPIVTTRLIDERNGDIIIEKKYDNYQLNEYNSYPCYYITFDVPEEYQLIDTVLQFVIENVPEEDYLYTIDYKTDSTTSLPDKFNEYGKYNNTNSRFSFTIYGGEKEPLNNELYKWENYKDNSRHYRGSFIIREDDVFNESYLYDFEIRTNVKTK